MTRLTLRTRIFLSYLLLIGLAVASTTLFVNRQILESAEQTFYDGFEEKVGFIAIEIEEISYEWFEEDLAEEEAFRRITDLADDLNVTVVLLNPADFEVFFDSRIGSVAYYLGEPEDMLHLEEEGSPTIFTDEAEEQVYSSAYIYFDDEPVLAVRVGQSWQPLTATQRNQTLIVTLSAVGLGGGLLLLLGSWLANALTRPLTELRQTAQAMAAGDLSTRANTNAPHEVAELARDVNQMAEAVESMVAEQRAFASNAAHELRTPLTAIRLRTETLLEDDPEPAVVKQYIAEIDEEALRLSELVDDLWLLAKLDSRKLVAGREQVDITRILRALDAEFAAQIEKKQLAYQLNLPDSLPTIQASIAHVQVVLRNLIENAIKYTPRQGQITVSVKLFKRTIRVTVRDTGIGIAEEHLPKLFNRFYRVDKARNRTIPGSGLGLSLAHSIVSLYNGKLSISSKGVGQGTTARVSFPLDE